MESWALSHHCGRSRIIKISLGKIPSPFVVQYLGIKCPVQFLCSWLVALLFSTSSSAALESLTTAGAMKICTRCVTRARCCTSQMELLTSPTVTAWRGLQRTLLNTPRLVTKNLLRASVKDHRKVVVKWFFFNQTFPPNLKFKKCPSSRFSR